MIATDPSDVAPDPARVALDNTVPIDPICITPVEPVHVDPVSVTSADSNLITVTISFAFITLSGIKHIRRTVKNHLYSISLTHVGVFAVFWS
jgi:hypothetical protein